MASDSEPGVGVEPVRTRNIDRIRDVCSIAGVGLAIALVTLWPFWLWVAVTLKEVL
jgi:hypothetical protein